ncbi:MAG: hypothetical protein B7Y89_16440 [Novosphingobium sp. 32-60-15]|nr:MAG: hypothetical protein B7Y89_16440 [Novosphingobium sp. 32-60-15]
MPTVRNRVASKPRTKSKTPARGPRKKQAPAFMLNAGNPPAFPTGLIIPPPRGAMITAVPWPEVAAPKPRKTAKPVVRRKAATAKPVAPKTAAPRKPRVSPKSRSPKAPAIAAQVLTQDAPAPMMTEDLLDRALAMRPQPADMAVPRVPASPPHGSTSAEATSPIPRSQALATTRGHGLFDIIGYWLRDAASWLDRLTKSRRKAEDRTQAARAKARQHALQSQFDALEALREVAKAD